MRSSHVNLPLKLLSREESRDSPGLQMTRRNSRLEILDITLWLKDLSALLLTYVVHSMAKSPLYLVLLSLLERTSRET